MSNLICKPKSNPEGKADCCIAFIMMGRKLPPFHVTTLGSSMYTGVGYMDDPNVVTWKGGNFLPIMIKAIQQSALPSGFDFGFAYQIAHYDSSKTLRYYRRAAVVFGDQSPVWKVKVYSYVNAQT